MTFGLTIVQEAYALLVTIFFFYFDKLWSLNPIISLVDLHDGGCTISACDKLFIVELDVGYSAKPMISCIEFIINSGASFGVWPKSLLGKGAYAHDYCLVRIWLQTINGAAMNRSC